MVGVSSPALTQTTDNNNKRAWADCLQAADQKYADQKYKDTWKALCEKTGRFGHCIEFVGSPRDKEFSQLRLDEMGLCSKLTANREGAGRAQTRLKRLGPKSHRRGCLRQGGALFAQDRQQSRAYDARGNGIGTATPIGEGSVRYHDAQGRSLGTSTTVGNTATFYDARGRVTGTSSGPPQFPGEGK